MSVWLDCDLNHNPKGMLEGGRGYSLKWSAKNPRRAPPDAALSTNWLTRSDHHFAMLTPAISARLSPSVLPKVGATRTPASHDAAILHGLTSDFILVPERVQPLPRRHNPGHEISSPQSSRANEISVFRVSHCFSLAKRLCDEKPRNGDRHFVRAVDTLGRCRSNWRLPKIGH